jgi:flagellar basal body rod protein FlgG
VTSFVNPWNLIRSMKSLDDWSAIVNSNLAGSTRIGFKQSDVFFGGGVTNILKPPGLTGEAKQIAEDFINIRNTRIDFSQGSLAKTNVWTNVAVDGDGFFMTTDKISNPKPDPDIQYTRNGEWHLDDIGMLRTAEGLYVLDGSQIPGGPNPAANWVPPWIGSVFNNWNDREKLRVDNKLGRDLTKNTVVEFTYDTASLVNAGSAQSSMDDIRIGYYDSTLGNPAGWVEVPMEIVPGTENSGKTKMRFRLQKDLPAGSSQLETYFLFYDNAGASPQVVAPQFTIGVDDPNGAQDQFNGAFSPQSDGVTAPDGPEDWVKSVFNASDLWKAGLPDSPSDTWAGVAAGNIDYTKGDGYQFLQTTIGNQEVYKVPDVTKPGGYRFVDGAGVEITMKVINGTNFSNSVDPNYDFRITTAASNPTLHNAAGDYQLFDPSDPSITNLPPLRVNGSTILTYDSVINGWGATPYDAGSGIQNADVPNTIWNGIPGDTEYEYALIRQPIDVSAQGVIRQGGGIDISGFVNKDVTVVLRKADGTIQQIYSDNDNNITGNNFSTSQIVPYNDLQPGTNYLEFYATRRISTVPGSPFLIPLDTSNWPGYAAGSINYNNGQGYNFTNEQLWLDITYVAGNPTYKIVKADGTEPQMQVLTDVKSETLNVGEFGQSSNGTIADNAAYGNNWINRTGTSITDHGAGYWHDLPDVYHPVGGTGGGDMHVSNTVSFSRTLIEGAGGATENVTITGDGSADDGFSLGYMSGTFSSLPGDWEASNGYGYNTTFKDTPDAGGITRVYSAGSNLAPLGLPRTTTTGGTASFNQQFNTNSFNETSTFILSGLDGDVGKKDLNAVALNSKFETTLGAEGWTVNAITGNPPVTWQTDNNSFNTGAKSAYFGNPVLDNYVVPTSSTVPAFSQNFETGTYSVGQHLVGDPAGEGWQVPPDPSDGSWVVRDHSAISGVPASFGNILYQEINQGGFGTPGSFILKGDPTWDNYSFSATMGTPDADNDLIRMWVRVSGADSQGPTDGYFLFVDGGGHGQNEGASSRFGPVAGDGPHTVGLAKMIGGQVTVLASNLGSYNSGTTSVTSNGFAAWQASYGDVGGVTDWWNFKITVSGDNIQVYATPKNPAPTATPNILLADITDSTYAAGKFAIENLSYASWYDNISFDPEPEPAHGELISPTIDLNNWESATLDFADSFQTEPDALKDLKKVWISDDDGATYTEITAATGVGGGGSQGWVNHTYPLPASYMNKQVKVKFEFDTVDTANQNFRGWNIDDVKVTGVKILSHPATTWAGGNGSQSSLNTSGVAVTGRTIAPTTSMPRYYVDNFGVVHDRFGTGGDGLDATDLGHTNGSTQKSNANGVIEGANNAARNATLGDENKLFDYIPDTTNPGALNVFTLDNTKGLQVTQGQSNAAVNGIQSIDAFQTIARYYVDSSGNVRDRFGSGAKSSNDNIYMTSNPNGILSDEFALGDEKLIDYDPTYTATTGGMIVDLLVNVPDLDADKLSQVTTTLSSESRLAVDGTGINNATGFDGVSYSGADSWNEYVAELDFGVSTPNTTTGSTYLYMRQEDSNHWLRVKYDVNAGTMTLQKNTGSGPVNVGSPKPFFMADAANIGARAKIIAEGEHYQVIMNNTMIFDEIIPDVPLLGEFAVGAERSVWYDNLSITQQPLLNTILSLGDGVMMPNGPDDIVKQMYLLMFPAIQGLRYDRTYGGTYFEETADSGTPKAEKPGQNGAGNIHTFALETSNVNMSKQITGLTSNKSLFETLSKQFLVYLDNIDSALTLFR